ncbi:MAG: GTP 3',8-cyclase MoaA [Clostridia bacterium]|jgi:cyclic pyranopterin phosphate synthase|nr:GTP 3',8-cyclase MoaA [Clostridia bacterium]MDH7572082.1 GTP 3',8-cyclase MoaA [Clostridia bacterium]
MRDRWGRNINYLRVSVTDRCNLRCRYCMPEEGVERKSHEEILRLEEMVRLLEVAVGLGLTRIRFTGGEPLVRRNFPYLVARTAELAGIEDLALTTNGILLAEQAADLRRAGLRRVNISLDTLDPEKYAFITRGGELTRVWAGIEAALAVGFDPVKINVVIFRGFNEEEIEGFARLTQERPLHVRFIELMPLGAANGDYPFLPATEVLARLGRVARLEPVRVAGNGPAEYYRLPGGKGTLGVIAALTRPFCATCNRLRLTADGQLRPCLESDFQIDLRGPLRAGAGEAELAGLFRQAVAAKPRQHRFGCRAGKAEEAGMWQIGG